MGNLTILCGPTAKHFGGINENAAHVDFQRFPSGESYCQIKDNIRGRDTFVVQSICSPANDSLMDLLVLGDAARRASAGRLTAVIPYMGYMRQDRKDKPRVPISAKLIIDMIECAGYDRIMTMDVHTLQAQGFTNIPFDHLFSYPIMAQSVRTMRQHWPGMSEGPLVFLSPDTGAIKRAQAYAEAFGCGFGIVNKKRLSPHQVKASSLIGDVQGAQVVITDDLTESCSTLISAAKIAREHGAIGITVAVTHPCLTEQGIDNLRHAFDEKIIDRFITTNTINSARLVYLQAAGYPILIESCDSFLLKAIVRTHRNESITEMFKVQGF